MVDIRVCDTQGLTDLWVPAEGVLSRRLHCLEAKDGLHVLNDHGCPHYLPYSMQPLCSQQQLSHTGKLQSQRANSCAVRRLWRLLE
ncbi:hypothetical protein GN956_G10280 [Arapaima gigas]